MKDLFVCRSCGLLWYSWIDKREGWRGVRQVGPTATPIFATETSLSRIADWVTGEYREEIFRPVYDLAKIVVSRRPDGLAAGVESILEHVGSLTPPRSELEAERLTMMFRMLTLVVERVIRGDLRGPGLREKPPLRWSEEQIAAEAERFEPREESGLARLALTHDVVRRLLWERRWGDGAMHRDESVIAIDDVSPILDVLATVPFDCVAEGGKRGVFAAAAFEAASEVLWRGLVPENDHAIWMSSTDWNKLRRAVDPVVRLADSARRLIDAGDQRPDDMAERFSMESTLVRVPIQLGARFTDAARVRLAAMVDRIDGVAASVLLEIIAVEQKALAADANCRILPRE